MDNNLIQLHQEFQNIQVTISLKDLIEANTILVQQVKDDLQQQLADEKAEVYFSREKAMEIFDVSSTTLWRWEKKGYLIPIMVGGYRRYRKSDINKILKGEQQ